MSKPTKRKFAQRSTPVVSQSEETISATQARIHFGELIQQVHAHRKRFVIEKDGLAVMVLLSVAEYAELQHTARQSSKAVTNTSKKNRRRSV